jgi:hypothetical protein
MLPYFTLIYLEKMLIFGPNLWYIRNEEILFTIGEARMIKKSKFLLLLIIIFSICSVSVYSQMIRTKYKCLEKNPQSQQIRFNFMIMNDTGIPVPLSELKIRYYYSKEGLANEEFHIDYAAIGSSNIISEFYRGYVEISFKQDAGVIPNTGNSGEIQVRINMSDWMVYDQSNDHSFNPTRTEWTDFDRITIFWKNARVWGTEGSGEPILSNVKPSPSP